MTISGQIDNQRLLKSARIRVFGVLIAGCVGLCISLFLLWTASVHHQPVNAITQIGILVIFPLLAAGPVALASLMSGWSVVEFTCDESSLRFRTRGSDQQQIRVLSDIARVRYFSSRSGTGYEVTFRDGAQIALGRSLPNAKELADWLYTHCRDTDRGRSW